MADGRKTIFILSLSLPLVADTMSSAYLTPRYTNGEETAATTADPHLLAVNDARAIRIAEIMTDFRNLQHHMAQIRASPTAEEYYLEGYTLLRACIAEAQQVLHAPFNASSSSGGSPETQKALLREFVSVSVNPFADHTNAVISDHRS